MKRFEDKERPAPGGTRSGPRARAAQDRKFGEVRARPRDSGRADPYQRADRPPRPDAPRSAPYAERLRAPTGSGITLDPDVARVFRDSDAVNEALRMVIRLARSVGAAPRPAFNRSAPPPGARSAAPPGARSGPPAGRPRAPSERGSRDERPKERRASSPPVRREPKFQDSE